ncbi:probable LRR receptor-like serine/threonine-protein kinase At1g06840 [Dendrobium catenatum]|uniref:Putative LRR receptor-like serine/threonine-protein kinase n=1 Tax=Dendrobium catenatum TaxID=906689 RepID=A0A2I0VP17_9ASPA|nr:probable LRR receptor-like serine/threonine-protein kinase At1g06840 [Dendrobium catenatum]PKU65156.1 putative LRR receptor-like serine/threonine-protein kinase [Dendrobium catenatum]
MQPISFGKNLVREVNLAYQSGRTFEIIDSRMGSYPSDCIEKFATLAYSCCRDQPDARPSMAEIVRELENIWMMMPEGEVLLPESSRDPDKESAPLFSTFSSSAFTHPYLSFDVSGSNHDSSSTPNIKPR